MSDLIQGKLNTAVVSNGWAIMGVFNQDAKDAGWAESRIREVFAKANNGDYDHLVDTLKQQYTEQE